MTIFTTLQEDIIAICIEAFGDKQLDYSRLVVELPRDESHGDLSTNAAMVLAKQIGMPPRELA
ncbi:MAG: arginine--tRNA ligase, partial [Candidatus Puniceispirillaceae bacterium]